MNAMKLNLMSHIIYFFPVVSMGFLTAPSDILLNVFLAIAVDNLASGDGDGKKKK